VGAPSGKPSSSLMQFLPSDTLRPSIPSSNEPTPSNNPTNENYDLSSIAPTIDSNDVIVYLDDDNYDDNINDSDNNPDSLLVSSDTSSEIDDSTLAPTSSTSAFQTATDVPTISKIASVDENESDSNDLSLNMSNTRPWDDDDYQPSDGYRPEYDYHYVSYKDDSNRKHAKNHDKMKKEKKSTNKKMAKKSSVQGQERNYDRTYSMDEDDVSDVTEEQFRRGYHSNSGSTTTIGTAKTRSKEGAIKGDRGVTNRSDGNTFLESRQHYYRGNHDVSMLSPYATNEVRLFTPQYDHYFYYRYNYNDNFNLRNQQRNVHEQHRTVWFNNQQQQAIPLMFSPTSEQKMYVLRKPKRVVRGYY
tara:strand:- start:718 stop:1791 length:1074 start_codon:yes stop_codon:yes gene_type:complete